MATKEAVENVFNRSVSDYEKVKAIAKAYTIKRNVQFKKLFT